MGRLRRAPDDRRPGTSRPTPAINRRTPPANRAPRPCPLLGRGRLGSLDKRTAATTGSSPSCGARPQALEPSPIFVRDTAKVAASPSLPRTVASSRPSSCRASAEGTRRGDRRRGRHCPVTPPSRRPPRRPLVSAGTRETLSDGLAGLAREPPRAALQPRLHLPQGRDRHPRLCRGAHRARLSRLCPHTDVGRGVVSVQGARGHSRLRHRRPGAGSATGSGRPGRGWSLSQEEIWSRARARCASIEHPTPCP